MKEHYEQNINGDGDPEKRFDVRYKDAKNLSAAVHCDTER